jgi:rod shape-determining protein MreC
MRISRQRLWLIVGLAVLATGLCAVQLRRRPAWRLAADFHHPFLAAKEAGRTTAAESALLLKGKRDLARSVALLQRQNEMLRAQLLTDGDAAREIAELRQLLRLAPRLSFRTIYAEVRSRDPLAWRESLIINKGEEEGIREGAVVLCSLSAGEGDDDGGFAVVGRVVEVSRHSAQVATMLSPRCQFSVILAESQLCGVAQGRCDDIGAAKAWIQYLPRDGGVRTGEMVLTSGYSGMTPPGLLLGWVAGRPDGSPETRSADLLHLEAGFLTAADIDRVRILLVLAPERDGHD